MSREVVKEMFGIEEDSGKILDEEFIFTQLSPKISLRTSIKIAKNLGGPLGKALGSIQKTGSTGKPLDDYEMDMPAIGSSLKSLFTQLDEDTVVDIAETMLTTVLYKGRPLELNALIFQGNLQLMYKITFKAIQVNFGDFFLKGFTGLKNPSPEEQAQAAQGAML